MLRALLLGGAFVLFSPAIRGYVFAGIGEVEKIVNQHSVATMVVSGAVVFFSFLAIQLSSTK